MPYLSLCNRECWELRVVSMGQAAGLREDFLKARPCRGVCGILTCGAWWVQGTTLPGDAPPTGHQPSLGRIRQRDSTVATWQCWGPNPIADSPEQKPGRDKQWRGREVGAWEGEGWQRSWGKEQQVTKTRGHGQRGQRRTPTLPTSRNAQGETGGGFVLAVSPACP